jgi:type I restriction enzyme S subunit
MPDGWDRVQLTDVATFLSGGTPKKDEAAYWEGDIPWISGATLTDRRLRTSNRRLTPKGVENGSRIAPAGASLILVRGMSLLEEIRIGQATRDLAFNQDVKALVPASTVDPWFLTYALLAQTPQLLGMVHQAGHGTGVLATDRLRALPIFLPPLKEQRRIAGVLGILDDLIETDRRARGLLRELGRAKVAEATAMDAPRCCELGELTVSISRGITPKYSDDDTSAPLILNQRCVRDNWVSTEPARRMLDREVPSAKKIDSGDVLVNSTGVGTLGRVGRWHSGSIFADSHISIVKADPTKVSPTVLAYLLFAREADIEGMSTGSTGQTELSPARLGQLVVELPTRAREHELEALLAAFENKAASLRDEEASLVALRDVLLPELLSGRVRVPEAEEAIARVGV